MLELFIPSGFVLFFAGTSAIVTGLLVLAGLSSPSWLPWLICAVLAVILLVFARKKLMGRFAPSRAPSPDEEIAGQEVVAKENIKPGGTGQGELRGTVWAVRNVGASILKEGERYRIESIDGLTLKVRG